MNWLDRLNLVCDTARFIMDLDVIDVSFESGHSLELYVAVSQRDRAQGLSNLSSLDVDGMIFYYPTPTYVPFGMRNMEMDLDIGWFDASGKMIGHGSYDRNHKHPIVSPRPFSYVIETPKGTLPISDLSLNG